MTKNILHFIILGTLFLFPKQSISQCYITYDYGCSPSPGCHQIQYGLGDTVSYGGFDYVLTNVNWISTAPPFVPSAWSKMTTTCSTGKPGLYETKLRARYCTSAMPVGRASSNGNDALLSARGFVYGTSPSPNLNDDNVLLDAGNSIGDEYEGLIEDLTPETTYYVRSYATNSQGTTYGTEIEFKTRKSIECVSDCYLACDITDSKWLDPTATEWSNPSFSNIAIDDTVCITQDVNITGNIVLYGMFKMCNNATVTLTGSIDVQTKTASNPSYRGQVVYEGCNEIFAGIGSYSGEYLNPPGIDDPLQMISYCSTCDENDKSQFFGPSVATAYWTSATCRPTTTLLNPLPVELISFKASLANNGAILEWVTGSEINNSHFDVEISNDGVNWTTIGIVQGSGDSNQPINYSFSSNQTDGGIHYFRLKQIDFDGSFAYSNVKYVSFTEGSKPKGFIAFQNSNNQVEIQAKFNGMGEALLYDSRGKLIEFKTFISTNNSGTNIKFNTVDLAEGVYFVKIKSGNALLGDKVQIIK